MTDAGVSYFESLKSHVHWVYCAYLLLKLQKVEQQESSASILQRQKLLTNKWQGLRYRTIIQLSTRFNGATAVSDHCYQALEELKLG